MYGLSTDELDQRMRDQQGAFGRSRRPGSGGPGGGGQVVGPEVVVADLAASVEEVEGEARWFWAEAAADLTSTARTVRFITRRDSALDAAPYALTNSAVDKPAI